MKSNNTERQQLRGFSRERLVFFSDAVFAICWALIFPVGILVVYNYFKERAFHKNMKKEKAD
jgi:hypothetical protein